MGMGVSPLKSVPKCVLRTRQGFCAVRPKVCPRYLLVSPSGMLGPQRKHLELGHGKPFLWVSCGHIWGGGSLRNSFPATHLSLKRQLYCKTGWTTYPFSSGMTLPTAFAAPVDAGMMFWAAPLPSLHSFPEGPSTVFCVAVMAWTVVWRKQNRLFYPIQIWKGSAMWTMSPALRSLLWV